MKYIDDINLFKSNKDFVAEIDMTGSLGRISDLVFTTIRNEWKDACSFCACEVNVT